MFKFLTNPLIKRKNIYQWQKANSLMAKGNIEGAYKIYASLHLQDGTKQVCMVQSANALNRMGKKQEALKLYRAAIESEKQWGKRKNRDNCQYIIGYAEFFSDVIINSFKNTGDYSWVNTRIVMLNKITAGNDIKKYYLPLPKQDGK